jgi:two-component system chemotaxis sensor kinase CheA
MDDMDLSQFREIFLSEAKEHLVSLNSALLELEKNPSNKETINQIFRAAHTLKGMAATMGFESITKLSHNMENVLDKIRKNEIQVKPNVIDLIFKSFDTLEKLVEDVGNNTDSKINIDALIALFNELIEKKEITSKPQEKPAPQPAPSIPSAPPAPKDEPKPEAQNGNAQPVAKEAETTTTAAAKANTSIRINISYLDTMMNLVGEMVISKSQLEQIGQKHKIEELNEALQQFDRIAIDLQEAVLKTRMVPLSQIFDRYPRMIRDLSIKLGKDVDFEIFGADIDIDRLLLDEINEPLVHLLRNAIDHGIESPENRKKAGKPAKSRISLKASRERGYISIEVKDDGKGLDTEVIMRKAIEKNIISQEIAKALTEEEIFMIICDNRFSTAEKVSDISGRGVGMDVVKTVIESINGNFLIKSQKGKGSSFILNLPLTMAIISALLVKVKDETFAIPLNNITEIVPYEKKNVKSIEGKEVIVLRDQVLPLIRLSRKLDLDNTTKDQDNGFILRVETSNKSSVLLIDNFLGRKEIVIKSLTGIMKRAKGFSGATILGDGSVVLILDIGTII